MIRIRIIQPKRRKTDQTKTVEPTVKLSLDHTQGREQSLREVYYPAIHPHSQYQIRIAQHIPQVPKIYRLKFISAS